jgi:hypothetical protein
MESASDRIGVLVHGRAEDRIALKRAADLGKEVTGTSWSCSGGRSSSRLGCCTRASTLTESSENSRCHVVGQSARFLSSATSAGGIPFWWQTGSQSSRASASRRAKAARSCSFDYRGHELCGRLTSSADHLVRFRLRLRRATGRSGDRVLRRPGRRWRPDRHRPTRRTCLHRHRHRDRQRRQHRDQDRTLHGARAAGSGPHPERRQGRLGLRDRGLDRWPDQLRGDLRPFLRRRFLGDARGNGGSGLDLRRLGGRWLRGQRRLHADARCRHDAHRQLRIAWPAHAHAHALADTANAHADTAAGYEDHQGKDQRPEGHGNLSLRGDRRLGR